MSHTSEDYDEGEISLEDMVQHELLHCDLGQICLDTAYCAYHVVSPGKRPEAVYEILVKRERDEAALEAAGLLNDVSVASAFAKKYAAVHPGLYLSLLENRNGADISDMVSLGREAIKMIPKNYTACSRAALKTAEYIVEAEKNQGNCEDHKKSKNTYLLEKCYFVAYESDTSALNYIRALLNGYGTEEKREELRKVFMAVSTQKSGSSYSRLDGGGWNSEREENRPDSTRIFLLRFLDGQFADVLAKGLNKSEALGWSGTFMKQGIALYLLYLYEGPWTLSGIQEMASIVKSAMGFSAKEYQRGLREQNDTGEEELFYDLFLKWKALVPMEPDVQTRALKKIKGLLEKRVKGIMEASRRNYYGECAAYLAALGEVQESLGEAGAKQKLMTAYKDQYPRRNAFREELRRYGWIDGGKRRRRQ